MPANLHAVFSCVKHAVYQQSVYIDETRPMKDDYKRLLQAAKEIRGWRSPAEISQNLTKLGYEVSEQTLTNWKTRGVSRDGCLNVSAIVGCRPIWLERGDGPMEEGHGGAQEARSTYKVELEGPLVTIARRIEESSASQETLATLTAMLEAAAQAIIRNDKATKPKKQGDITPVGSQISFNETVAKLRGGQTPRKNSK